MIESTSSSSDSDDNQHDAMRLLDNKNNLVKLSAMIKIKRNLVYFTQHLMDKNDKNLIEGIFHNYNIEEEIPISNTPNMIPHF